MKIVWRRFVSLTLVWTAFLVTYSGIMLFIAPHGRTAYWNDWYFWGLNKTEYEHVHIQFSVLFIMVVAFHIYFNWKSIILYLKNKLKKLTFATKEMILATIVAIFFFVGAHQNFPPFSYVTDLGLWAKDYWTETIGDPPYGHAELSSLKTFCAHLGFDLQEVLDKLNNEGLKVVDSNKTILDISRSNHITSQQLYELIKGQKSINTSGLSHFGYGQLSVLEVCTKEGIDLQKVKDILGDEGLQMNFKKAAQKLDLHPMEFLQKLRNK